MSKVDNIKKKGESKDSPFTFAASLHTLIFKIQLKELLTKTPHHVAWFLAQHIYSILLTDMRYHMKKLMTDGVDDAAIRFTLPNGKNTPSFS